MSLLTQLDQDLATAMKGGDSGRTTVIRLIKTSIKNDEIKLGHELSEDEVLKVVAREAKQRRDSIRQYGEAGRQDLVDQEQAELEIISAYLPKQLDEAELAKIVDTAIATTGATSAAQMGQVIGAVIKQVGGAADGAAISKLVRARLQ